MGTWLADQKRLEVLAALVDGNSERGVGRMTGVARATISSLALAFGQGAVRLHNRLVKEVQCSLCDLDELWGWVKVKGPRLDPKKHNPALVGDQWTWVALDRTSRLVISWFVGRREAGAANALMADVRSRVATAPQFFSDGLALYEQPIAVNFGPSADYGQMVKHYRGGAQRSPDHKYDPARDPFITKKVVLGAPDMDKCSTFALERQHATMRHLTGRLRRLVYAFSKDLEHHKAAVGLCYAYYNLCWIVSTLRVTPAMEARVTNHVWELGEFMETILSEPDAAKPELKLLAPRIPSTPARALPGNRGFLRLVGGPGGGGAEPSPSPTPVPAPAGQSAAPAVVQGPPPETAPQNDGQADLLAWKSRPPSPEQKSRRLGPEDLGLFGIDLEPEPKK